MNGLLQYAADIREKVKNISKSLMIDCLEFLNLSVIGIEFPNHQNLSPTVYVTF